MKLQPYGFMTFKHAAFSVAMVLILVMSSLAQVLPGARSSDGSQPAGDFFQSPNSLASKLGGEGKDKPLTSVKPTDGPTQKLSPEEAALALKTDVLIRRLESADSDDQTAEIKAKLSDLLGTWFDLRLNRQEREIEALEAQVKRLRELATKRRENRAEIISRKLDQLVRDSQGLGF